MNATLRFLYHCLLLFLTLPAWAQLDPKLQVCKTDFSDLYQKNVTKTYKPEIVCVLDFSGSMNRIMYDSRYTNSDHDDGDTHVAMSFRFTGSGVSQKGQARISIGGSTRDSTDLIRPDGEILTKANIDTYYAGTGLPGENFKSTDIRNWVRCASHARFTYNGRTIDLPIGWTILDSFNIQPTADPDPLKREYRRMYNTYPLKMIIQDPFTLTEVEMDDTHRRVAPGTGSQIFSTSTSQVTSFTLGNANAKVTYSNTYLTWLFSGTCPVAQATADEGKAFRNGIPAMTRNMGVKAALLRVWCAYHHQVFFACRALNYYTTGDWGSVENSRGTTLNAESAKGQPSAGYWGAAQRGWILFNGNSLGAMQKIASLFAYNGTPLTYAMGNALAQYNDPNSVFNAVAKDYSGSGGTDDRPNTCMKHFLLLFTDGQPNSDGGGENTNTPYMNASGVGNANMGNAVISENKSLMNPNSSYWNIANLAAVAAHGYSQRQEVTSKIEPGTYPTADGVCSAFLPFFIKSRGNTANGNETSFTKPHPITTMTVGVSLGGTTTTAGGGKKRMMMAACMGDTNRTSWDLTKAKPYTIIGDPEDPASKPDPDSVYFFDAASPDELVRYLKRAFRDATAAASVNSVATPSIPIMGLSLGAQVYVGTFAVPEGGGPMWSGNLFSFATYQSPTGMVLIGQDGKVTTELTAAKAAWNAKAALEAKGWANRNTKTRLIGGAGLIDFKESNYAALKDHISTSRGTDPVVDPFKKDDINFMRGCDVALATKPNRANIMGDIINSSPMVLEFDTAKIPASAATLTAALAAHTADKPRFRVIFVGTNQGWMHAFGEVSWVKNKYVEWYTEPGNVHHEEWVDVTEGVVEELWAFLPTDFLKYIDTLRDPSNQHYFTCDGTPLIYHDDGSNYGIINGMVDGAENAYIVFGLGKGGRSYYCLKVNTSDLSSPDLAWAKRADELPADPIFKKMGLSTPALSSGRVIDGNNYYVDAVFIAGGLSTPELESSLMVGGSATKLGRWVAAIDIVSPGGVQLNAWDLTTDARNPGCFAAGIAPHEYFQGSGLIQRLYLNDEKGGLWAIGSTNASTDVNYSGFRLDNSKIANGNWGFRKVYQSPANQLFTSIPVTFNPSGYAYQRSSDPKVTPAAVGVVMATGDRNNPLDYYLTTTTRPSNNQLTLVYDRQDSGKEGKDTNGVTVSDLYNATGNADYNASVFAPGSGYLTKGYGWYVNFPGVGSGNFLPKSLNQPLILSGVIFYSFFKPLSADECLGGSGETWSYRLCDVYRPTPRNSDSLADPTLFPNTAACSGRVLTWAGVSTDYSARGTVSAAQGGIFGSSGGGNLIMPGPGGDQTVGANTMQVVNIKGRYGEKFPKARIWRTVK